MMRLHLILIFITHLIYSIKAESGYFLQITDIHYDKYYHMNAPTQCVDGLFSMTCCEKYSIPLPKTGHAQLWGDYNCDSPYNLINNTLKWIDMYTPPIDFIIWTGDSANHHLLTQTYNDNMDAVDEVTNLIKLYFPNITTYPTIGNHDSYPVDQFGSKIQIASILDKYTEFWSDWLIDGKETFSKYGFYSQLINDQIKIINLNCLIDDSNNIMGPLFSPHLSDIQSLWLINELENSLQINQSVWLMSHIPPGSGEGTVNFTNRLVNIVKKYHSIIKNQFYGHTHDDQYLLYWDDTVSHVIGHAYISSSLVPKQRNPTFRVYEYDKETFEIINYYHYLLNLTEVNRNNQFNYTLFYDAKQAYKLTDLSTSSWHKLAQTFESNENLLNDYIFRYNAGYKNDSCQPQQCKIDYICEILFIDKTLLNNCGQNFPPNKTRLLESL